MIGFLKKLFGSAQDRLRRKYFKVVQEVNQWDAKFQSLSDDALRNKTQEFRDRFQAGESVDQLLPEAFAVVKNACRRLAGTDIHVSGYDQKWDMVPYDVQIVGAIALHYGAIAEMHDRRRENFNGGYASLFECDDRQTGPSGDCQRLPCSTGL